ncbi:MAG: UTP--glucose-1-phosphate uridylyltransferase [Phycisphaerales bacterium]
MQREQVDHSVRRRLEDVRASLRAHQQEHILRFVDELQPGERDALLDEVEALDWEELDELIQTYVLERPHTALADDLAPASFFPGDPAKATGRQQYDPAHYRVVGEAVVREGYVAAFTVAGGQGTRLGWNGPKGTYPATPITGKPLFRVFAEQLQAASRKYDVAIPWYIMTSPLNDEATRAFFADNNYFSLDRRDVFFFPQGVMPSFDAASGKLLLASKHELAMNPDGHGGSLKGLARSGALEDMAARGIQHISYFQVDNPLVRIIDPLFIGLHASALGSSAEMSSKMVPKSHAGEKVGVFCQSNGRTMVVEYSDLPSDRALETDDDGSLRFVAGSIAIHLISVAFVQKLTQGGRLSLPWHRADKKVAYIDDSGALQNPESPNGVKLESFVFDAIPLAESSIVYETSRADEFAPIKNASGDDSAATSHQIQSNRNAAWLEQHGVTIPRDEKGNVTAVIEISPLTALDADDLADVSLPAAIEPGARIVL